MSKLFNSKSNAVPVKMSSNHTVAMPVDMSGIDLGIESEKNFDSMSTKSAGSRELKASDRSRLIDNDDDEDGDNENDEDDDRNNQLDFDFLNNW